METQDKTIDAAIHLSVRCNDFTTLQRLLEQGVDINKKLEDGVYGVHVATTKQMIEFLIKHGADVNAYAEAPCKNANNFDCQILDYHGQHPADCPRKTLYTALHLAIKEKDVGLTKHLLDNGADANLPDSDGQTPFLLACMSGCCTIINALLKAGANMNAYDRRESNPLKYAIADNKLHVFKLLVANGADLYSTGPDLTPLHEAARLGRLQMAGLLLDKGVPVDIRSISGKTPLIAAVADIEQEPPSFKMVKMLIDRGAKVSNYDCCKATVATYAAQRGYVNILQLVKDKDRRVLEHRAENGMTPLLAAVMNKRTAAVTMLLKSGVEVNCVGRDGQMPIHLAILRYQMLADEANEKILRELLEHGALFDDDQTRRLPSRPPMIGALRHLFRLVKDNDHQGVEESIRSGVIINGRDKNGMTALHHAALNNNNTIARLLVRAGINVTATTLRDKQTALHCAVHPVGADVLLTIVEYADRCLSPADKDKFLNLHRNPDDSSALHLARDLGNKRIIEILVRHGASEHLRPVPRPPYPEPEPDFCQLGCAEVSISYRRTCGTLAIEYYAVARRLFAKFARVEEAEVHDKRLAHVVLNRDCTLEDINVFEQLVELISMKSLLTAKTSVEGNTMLHLAPDVGTARALLAHGAFFEETNNEGKTPHQFTKDDEVRALIEDVMKAFADPDDMSLIERPPLSLYLAILHARDRNGQRCRHENEIDNVRTMLADERSGPVNVLAGFKSEASDEESDED